jgi:pilus assembly protein CpaF
VTADGGVSIERDGRLTVIPLDFSREDYITALQNIARQKGEDFSAACPKVDARLPNGNRACMVWPTVALGSYPTLNIRKHQGFRSLDELVRLGSITPEALETLLRAIDRRRNILISGGFGTGKTTLLRGLASRIPADQRIVTIEDTAEMNLRADPRRFGLVVELEAKEEQRDLAGKVISPRQTLRDLVKISTRERPDRIILGEIRGEEAFDLLKVLNSGVSGSLFTIHADSVELALEKLALYVLEAKDMPMEAICRHIGSAVHMGVQIERRSDGSRGVVELKEVRGYHSGKFDLRPY